MGFFLCELSINGCKNIDKKITFKFCNSTLKKNEDLKYSNTKAIYGPNGSGKSAVMTALYIYRRLIMDEDGLNDKMFSSLIAEMINKKTKELEIEVTIALFYSEDKYPHIIRHYLKIGYYNESIMILSEKISKLTGNCIRDDKFKDLIIVDKGVITLLSDTDNIDNEIITKSTLNLLNKYSVIVSFDKIAFRDDGKKNSINEYTILVLKLFAVNLQVVLMAEDRHLDYISKKVSLDDKKSDLNNNYRLIYFMFNYKEENDLLVENSDLVSINAYKKYESKIKRLAKFIKIFKPDLIDIEIDKKIENNQYHCKKIFVYNGYKIDIEFESTGLKKLVKLFTSLCECVNGKIVFIDEFDANLHDVYFTKLIEFLKEESKGQLCFTTHNLEPIDILKDSSHSLDFMSNDSRLSSWVKNGNKSPMKKYINGLIPYSTFNVETIDFEVLINEE